VEKQKGNRDGNYTKCDKAKCGNT